MPNLKPLKQWYCDKCGDVIESISDGWIEWLHDDNFIADGFKIVHQGRCLHYLHQPGEADMPMDYYAGEGFSKFLSHLDRGPYHEPQYKGPRVNNVRAFVEILRRLYVPYYEEARRYWNEALQDGFFEGANEEWIYNTETLKRLVKKYAD